MDIITLALAKKSSKSYVDNKLDAITTDMDYKGSVSSVEDLPSTATAGDIYTVSGDRYLYNGTEWEKISTGGSGGTVDDALNGNSTNAVQNKVITDALNSKANIDGVYPKLVAGDLVESETKDDVFTYQVTDHTGEANINSIKGNTLVWNQLLPSFTGSSDGGMTWSYDNGLISVSGTATNAYSRKNVEISIDTTHKYALLSSADQSATPRFNLASFSAGGVESSKRFGQIAQFTESGGVVQLRFTGMTVGETYDKSAYLMVIDLTQMFGAGNEPTSVAEFTKLFPLPYYAYESGKLLSFNGTGIKTVGKNLFNKSLTTNLYCDGSRVLFYNTDMTSVYIPLMHDTTYTYKQTIASVFNRIALCNSIEQSAPIVRPTTKIAGYLTDTECTFNSGNYDYLVCTIYRASQDTKTLDEIANSCQLEIGLTATDYEPYTSSTLSLPISTYFPTGMKRAGNVYDELTENKAITRIGVVDMGTLNWTMLSVSQGTIFRYSLTDMAPQKSEPPNVKCVLYPTIVQVLRTEKTISCGINTRNIDIIDSTYTSADAFKSAMSGVYLYYELATPTETDVDLDLSYSTYEGGTEQLLPVNTDVPVTSPISMNVEFDFGENLNARLNKMLSCLAQVETSPSTHNYSVGQYLMYEYQLYKVTSAITTGQSLTVGTNIVATTVMSELLSLTA